MINGCLSLSKGLKDIFNPVFLFNFICLSPLLADGNSTDLPEIRKVGDGIYEFGGVTINRNSQSISIHATTNQVNGLI